MLLEYEGGPEFIMDPLAIPIKERKYSNPILILNNHFFI